MTITYALMEKLEEIAEESDRAKIMLKTKVEKLLKDAAGNVIGVECTTRDGNTVQEYGPVIICTGDGLKMSMAVGADTVDLEWIQVHPPGLVHPEEPDAKVKFLAAEALRGVGGVLLDMEGKRFANELGRRDYVTGQMWKNKGLTLGGTTGFFLCLT